ncbi:MAG: cytochrome c, partial [Verrucomicrobiota bacterium]|nr:cytochrome c [Verrucomicrobiota bacterium]
GALGLGNGIVSQYGLAGPANFQQEKFRTMPDGQIFNTITNGKNTMGPYGSNVTVEDRWAIISYIRALQRSQNATIADVPEQSRAELDKAAAPAAPAAAPAAPASPAAAGASAAPQPAAAAASAPASAPRSEAKK